MCTMKKETVALAALKAQIKELTKSAKEMEKEILASDNPADKLKTEHGTMTLSTRVNWEPVNNDDFINHFGMSDFRQVATVTCSNIKKFFGANRVDDIHERGMLTVKSESKFYTLRS